MSLINAAKTIQSARSGLLGRWPARWVGLDKGRLHSAGLEVNTVRHGSGSLGGLSLLGAEGTGKAGLENEKLLLGNFVEGCWRDVEVLGEDFFGSMGEKISQQEGVGLIEISVVEDEKESATIGSEALNGVRNSGREKPQIALTHIADEASAVMVYWGECRCDWVV